MLRRSAVELLCRSVRPKYPAAPAVACWLNMCSFIRFQGLLHWLLGHLQHHIRSRRETERVDAVIKDTRRSLQIIGGDFTCRTHIRLSRKRTASLHDLRLYAKRNANSGEGGVFVCVSVHLYPYVPKHVPAPKEKTQPPPPCHQAWQQWQASLRELLKWCLSFQCTF